MAEPDRGGPPDPETELADRALALAGAVDADLTAGAAERIAAARAAARPVAVVVGEVKAGKSSLVNALLAAPDLSPVDVDVATRTFATFRNDTRASAWIHATSGGPPSAVALDELARWISDPAADVACVDVTVPAPWLGPIVLVDTPGAGGLVPAHAEIAARAAAQAAALIMVTSAAAPLNATELAFLTRVSRTVPAVCFVLTKTGKYPGWRDVLAQDLALVRTHAPQLARAPWVPVDSATATTALELRGGRHPADPLTPVDVDDFGLWEESGLGRVHDVLAHLVSARVAAMTTLGVLGVGREVVTMALRVLDTEIAALSRDRDARTEVAGRDTALRALADRRRAWGPQLDYYVNRIRNDAADDLASRVTGLRDEWNERFDAMRRSPSEAGRNALLDELDHQAAALAEQVLTVLREQLGTAAAELLPDAEELDALGAADDGIDPADRADVHRRRRANSQELMIGVLRSTSFAGGAGGVAAAVGLGSILWVLPIS
ncbi:MAG TPA: dynamin family protein, partial [Actinomycetospora sp.]|uniref:dynamin family protein n=1 Tax=Actinomycetospora sp. TaxID=1872135 RepID=UPI002F3FCCB3